MLLITILLFALVGLYGQKDSAILAKDILQFRGQLQKEYKDLRNPPLSKEKRQALGNSLLYGQVYGGRMNEMQIGIV